MNQPCTGLMLSSEELSKICTSHHWHLMMKLEMPFSDGQALVSAADKAFDALREEDWLEAFAGHPMIGDIKTLQAKYGQGKALSEKEQSQVKSASQEELEELLALNLAYQDKFGFIFIVCATNKSADEMLALLKERLPRSREAELKQAAIEQRKISRIRMEAYL
ncbi:2-oxo-4-hydroxy-4-carboxy-5-ureidoimidazoline decarboxylase [Vibrio olivae]|uniref:2-oxo-4-hydroxy-4-carboxy-5-ureidoimidazoline decarboxylase n=1 Tax=Vibrio olivae TaxID=1243002 RepID=A0ABV5HTU1_9VIBR